MLISSRLIAVAEVPEGLGGYVRLGALKDGRAVLHVAPDNGITHELTAISDHVATFESVQPKGIENAEGFEVLYNPTPEPFRWETFAAEYPELAATLTPHQWAGE